MTDTDNALVAKHLVDKRRRRRALEQTVSPLPSETDRKSVV